MRPAGSSSTELPIRAPRAGRKRHDQCLSGDIELAGIGTDYQVADIFTKPLAHAKFRAFREVLCGYRSYEQLLNSNEEKQAEIRQLQAYDFRLQNQISLAGHPLAHLC